METLLCAIATAVLYCSDDALPIVICERTSIARAQLGAAQLSAVGGIN